LQDERARLNRSCCRRRS